MSQKHHELHEEGLEIPFERINPEILQKMVEEFVTREWGEAGDSACTLEEKVAQVIRQLEARTARIVYDVTTETWNIVASRQ
jgi:uncharacterized protein YheU (UPF0270 family)